MNLRKLNLGLVALLLGFGLVMTQSAFTTTNNTTTLKYRYDGDTEAGLVTPTNWTNVSSQTNPDSCEPGDEIPCLVVFDNYANIEAFILANPNLEAMILSNKISSYKDEVSK